MKKTVLIAIAFSLMAGSVYAGAIGAFGSYWSPEDADSGYGYGVRLASTSDPAGYLEIRASRFDDLTDDEDGMDTKLTVTPLDVGITLHSGSGDSVEFYVGGGGSYYLLDSEVEIGGENRDVDIDDEWGWYGLAGVEIGFSKNLKLFGEATYRQVEGTMKDDDIDNATSDANFKLDGFGGNAGIMLMF